MRNLIIAKLAAVAVTGLLSQSAFAADGTVNFIGEIVDAPCSIAPQSQNLTVPLGKVSRTTLDGAAGKVSAPAKFTIDLLGCGATATGATVTFAAPADATNANLLRVGVGEVDGSFATGVGIQVADSSGKQIPVGQASGNYTLAQGDNALSFQANYMSTGPAVTVGRGNAMAQFTVAYK